MISLSLLALPPYLTYILIGYGRGSERWPELNQELINSLHVYVSFILAPSPLDGVSLVSLFYLLHLQRQQQRLFIVGAVY